jgi:hypothetical protein
MTTLFIALGAEVLPVIGCVFLDLRPTYATKRSARNARPRENRV